MQELTLSDVGSIVASGNYGVCYEPIIDLNTMEVFAYEALSRFRCKYNNITPDVFFKTIHENIDLFFLVESLLKQFQLKHRIQGKKLFLNLDPDTCVHERHVEFWVHLFENNQDVIIEITENSDEENVEDIEEFIEWLDMYNLPYAYDDFGKPNSIYFASLLRKCQFIKLDIYFLRTIRTEVSYMETLRGIVLCAKLNKQYTVLEGVETLDDLEIARSVGVDYIQGYLFKDKFTTLWKQENR